MALIPRPRLGSRRCIARRLHERGSGHRPIDACQPERLDIEEHAPRTDISGVPPGFTPQALRAVSPRAAGATQAAEASGAPTFLATTQGVVWSFNIENGSGVVLRSTDDGNHWRVVLSEPTSQVSFGLVAGYFLGSDRRVGCSGGTDRRHECLSDLRRRTALVFV